MKKTHIIGIGATIIIGFAYVGTKMYASSIAEEKLDIAIANLVNYVDVDYRNVSVDLLGFDVHVSGIVVSAINSEDKINIDEIVIFDFDKESDIPFFLHIALNGIQIPIDQIEAVKKLGYDDYMLLNADIEYDYNKNEKEIVLNRIQVGADGVGDIEISLRLSNIDLNPENILAFLFTYPQIMLHNATIMYRDDSFIERLMKLQAETQDRNVTEMKDDIITIIEHTIEEEEDDFTKKVLTEIRKFVDSPEQFSISIEPIKPLPLGRIMRTKNPKDLIRILNIKIQS
jgi:hypothetical protein